MEGGRSAVTVPDTCTGVRRVGSARALRVGSAGADLGHEATTAMGIAGLYARPSPPLAKETVGRLWAAIAEGYEEVEDRSWP